ncbi:subtilisin-like protein [Lactarius hatsudake]|nr:subtilisin-like protein [Lactarius hatsudake]
MRHRCIVVLSVILLASLAKPLSPPWDNMHIKHSWNAVPTNWVSLGRPPSGTTIDLYIALKPNRENAVNLGIQGTYRAHLTKEQVADLVAPRPETLELVDSWLEHHDISSSSVSMTHGGNTLKLQGVSVTQANTLLGASYEVYRHVERGETIIRTVGYSLPRALHWHVLTVVPTTSFTSLRAQWQTPRNDSSGETVGLVKSASGEPVTMLSGCTNVDFATPSFLRWLPADLRAFIRKYRNAGDVIKFLTIVVLNDGVFDPTHPHEEANLDLQFAEAMAYPTPHTFYSIGRGPSGTDDWYVTWLEYILDQTDIPQTISISYGVLVSSGNHGIGRGTCVNQDGRVRFIPRFPATCPYVTVVGGTTDYEPEVAVKFSGGGFSDYFQRPLYQRQAVPTFLEDLGSRYQGLYNASGRGIPDIAAQSMNLPILFNNREQGHSGTSGATPVLWRGIISLLNDQLISTGRGPLGFLNPWLYGRGLAALNDITEGSNWGCGMDGFSAIAGWDPVRSTRLDT